MEALVVQRRQVNCVSVREIWGRAGIQAQAVARRDLPSLDHGSGSEIGEIVYQDQIGAIAGRDGAAIGEAVMAGRHIGGMPDGDGRCDATGHDASQEPVQMAVAQQIGRERCRQ